MAFGRVGALGAGFSRLGAGGHVSGAVAGGAALLVGETNGLGVDFTYATNTQRVAVKTAGATVSSGLSFFTSSGTSSKWVYDVTGTLVNVAVGTLPVDYHPTTHVARGLLVEPAATNLIIQSAAPATQGVTVTATAYTLSIFGTGTLTLTGASTAGPLVGTGANNRVSLTFTPTAGTLTLTKSGTVTNAQLETGSYASSYIPTLAATVTRATDNYNVLTSAFPFSNVTCSMLMIREDHVTSTSDYLAVNNGSYTESIGFYDVGGFYTAAGGAFQGQVPPPGVFAKAAGTAAANDFRAAYNGTLGTPDVAGTMYSAAANTLYIGGIGGVAGARANMHLSKLVIVPRAWSNAELTAKTV